jgi:hypothetical protein
MKNQGTKIGFVGLNGTWKFFNIATAKRFDLGSIGTLFVTSRGTYILNKNDRTKAVRFYLQIEETNGQDYLDRFGY